MLNPPVEGGASVMAAPTSAQHQTLLLIVSRSDEWIEMFNFSVAATPVEN